MLEATSSDSLVVTGDIKIRLDRSSDPLCQKFNELIESFGFVNRVQQPTHNRGGSLDVVLTRSDLPSPATIIIDIKDVGISDHSLIKWTTNLNAPPPIF